MYDLYLNKRSILTIEELKDLLCRPIDPASKLAEEIYEAVYEEDMLHWIQDRYPSEKALIAELKQISTQSPIGASELLGKITRLITKERVVVAKPAFKEHAKITKVEASSDTKNYKVYIEVTTPINELYVVELRAANAHTTIAKRRISLDVAYNVKEVVVEFTAIRQPINKSVFIDGVATPISPKQEVAQVPTTVISKYKVGDYYELGTKKGVVFWVNADGTSGKIVSLHSTKSAWCSESSHKVYTTHTENGSINQEAIEQKYDWEHKYPAFAWCKAQGKGWYLPAIEELKLLLHNPATLNAVNSTLKRHQAETVSDKRHWSSSEYNQQEYFAWSAASPKNNTLVFTFAGKGDALEVRAVAAFSASDTIESVGATEPEPQTTLAATSQTEFADKLRLLLDSLKHAKH